MHFNFNFSSFSIYDISKLLPTLPHSSCRSCCMGVCQYYPCPELVGLWPYMTQICWPFCWLLLLLNPTPTASFHSCAPSIPRAISAVLLHRLLAHQLEGQDPCQHWQNVLILAQIMGFHHHLRHLLHCQGLTFPLRWCWSIWYWTCTALLWHPGGTEKRIWLSTVGGIREHRWIPCWRWEWARMRPSDWLLCHQHPWTWLISKCFRNFVDPWFHREIGKIGHFAYFSLPIRWHRLFSECWGTPGGLLSSLRSDGADFQWSHSISISWETWSWYHSDSKSS